MHILLASSLWPNSFQQDHGLFVETRLRHLIRHRRDFEVTVVAPVPWFPSKSKRFGRYAVFASVPSAEKRNAVEVLHPRYLVIPKLGMTMSVLTMAYALRKALLEKERAGWRCDLIDAHYFFPDGVAATLVGNWLHKPVVITARGTDINLIPRFRIPRRLIQWAAGHCAHMITVCEALREELIKLGADPNKVVTLRNGVDLERFKPVDQSEARMNLNLPTKSRILLSVGHLVERKGHHLVVEAITKLPDPPLLLIAGEGEQRAFLEEQIHRMGLEDGVRLLGSVSHSDLPVYYSAADATVLASSREGMANVLLESLACGTPVAATGIWGTPEIVRDKAAGRLIEKRDATCIAQTLNELLQDLPDRADVRQYAEQFSWGETSRGQSQIFEGILQEWQR